MENNLDAIQTLDLNGHQQPHQEVVVLAVKYTTYNTYIKNIKEVTTNGQLATTF